MITYGLKLTFAKGILTLLSVMFAALGTLSFWFIGAADEGHLFESDSSAGLVGALIALNTSVWWALLLPPILTLLWRSSNSDYASIRTAAYLTALPVLQPVLTSVIDRHLGLGRRIFHANDTNFDITQITILALIGMAIVLSMSPHRTKDT